MSSATRVYVPVTRALLETMVTTGMLEGRRAAHAVTSALRATWPEADEEELEYVALCAAAEASWSMRGPQDPARRYVVAADLPVEATRPARGDPTCVWVAELFPRQVAAVHVDLQDLTDLEDDLAWFAPQELVNLLQPE